MPKHFGTPFLLIFQISQLQLNIRMRYGGSKLKNLKKCDFYAIFNNLNKGCVQ